MNLRTRRRTHKRRIVTLHQAIRAAFRKNAPAIMRNVTQNNALFRMLSVRGPK